MANTSGATDKPLPFEIELPIGFNLSAIDQYVSELKCFISSSLVQSLVLAHPNEVAIQGALSAEGCIAEWWTWAGYTEPDHRERLVNSLIQSAAGQPIPQDVPLHPSLRYLVEQTSRLRLPRNADTALVADPDSHHTPGMSPKKAHEVDRLSCLIDKTYWGTIPTRLIVDVGAGQGYLSRRLAKHPNTCVLALDGDEEQTEGATLRGQGLSHAERQRARVTSNKPAVGRDQHSTAVTHRTLFITSDSLLSAVDEWTAGLKLDPTQAPHPVLVTGLHACGSLTPAVLRCFVDLYNRSEQGVPRESERAWTPNALVLVGCCYNLMRNKDDFPLSRITTRTPPDINLELSQNHLQLAAQCPAQWIRSQSEMERARLARRKIVWRALLARILHTKADGGLPGRLGRLPDRAYTSWEVFLQTACQKMALDSARLSEHANYGPEVEILAFQLEILHVLRALIGPVIESLVIVDRVLYLAEELVSSDRLPTFQVRAVNVFDQLSSGSARNIALIVEPLVDSTNITEGL